MKTKVAAKLDNGDDVTILGEQDEYFKIAPPKGVYLYVNRQFVESCVSTPMAGDCNTKPRAGCADAGRGTKQHEASRCEVHRRSGAFDQTAHPDVAPRPRRARRRDQTPVPPTHSPAPSARCDRLGDDPAKRFRPGRTTPTTKPAETRSGLPKPSSTSSKKPSSRTTRRRSTSSRSPS